MVQAAEVGQPKRGVARFVIAAILTLQALAIVGVLASEHIARRAERSRMAFNLNPGAWWRENVAKPTLTPSKFTAAEASLAPDELIFGVEVGGKARAYRLAAFDDPSGHLVNDLIGGVPVSVAYCNMTRCVRVYTDPNSSAPLDAEVSGLLNGQMIIKLGGIMYFHNAGLPVEPDKNPPPIPYRRLTPTVTTWEVWTKQHPQTDVFVGGR